MTEDIDDFEEPCRKAAAQSEQREYKERHESAETTYARHAFARCFVEILREVNRKVRGSNGVEYLEHFFQLLERGARVKPWDLTQAALDTIKPAHQPWRYDDDPEKTRDRLLLNVAKAGLALLVEHGATDQNAGGRRSQREYNLHMAICAYMEAHAEVIKRSRLRP
jgi:hypothetical protein